MGISASKKDIIWNYIGIVMSMGSNFLLLPFMIKFVDSEFLGLWYVYLSIGGIVTLFDFGFNPTMARNVAYCWSGAKNLNQEGVIYIGNSDPNYKLLGKVIATCKRIYLIISLTALFALLTIGSVYIYYISKDIFGLTVIASWLIYSIAVFLNLYYGYYATFLRGVGAVSIYNKVNVLARIIQIVFSIVLLCLGYGIIAVACAYLLYGFLLRFISKHKFYKYKDIGAKLNEINMVVAKEEIKKIFFVVWHNAWRDGVVTLSNYCANQASTLICSLFLSLSETGTYSISVQLITAIATIAAGLYTAYQPSMQSAYINKRKDESERLMATAMTAYTLIFVIGVFALITVGIPILQVFKPSTVFSRTVIIGIGIYNYLYKRQSYYASFISNTNHVPYMNAYIISSLLGVLLSVFLVSIVDLGVWGLIIGQLFPQLIYNCWKWPKDVYSMLETNPMRMLRIGSKQMKAVINRK